MMGKDSKGSHDAVWLEKRLEGVSASRLLDRDLDVSEIRRRLVVRGKNRRLFAGSLAAAAMVLLLFVVSRWSSRDDVLDRGLLAEIETGDSVGADRKASDSELLIGADMEMERLVAEAEAARVRSEEFQSMLDALKRERAVRVQEVAVAKLVRARAGQEHLLGLIESGQ